MDNIATSNNEQVVDNSSLSADQVKPEAVNEGSNDNLDTYFTDLMSKSEKTEPQAQPLVQPSSGSPKALSAVDTVLSRYGLSSINDIDTVYENDRGKYHMLNAELAAAINSEQNQVELNNIRVGMAINQVLVTAKGQGINPDELTAFCRYHGMPINDRSLEAYKTMRKGMQSNNNISVINQVVSQGNGAKQQIHGTPAPIQAKDDFMDDVVKIAQQM